MELIERIGGLGKVKLTKAEYEAFGELLDLFEKEKKMSHDRFYYISGEKVSEIIKTLFPFNFKGYNGETLSSASLERREFPFRRNVYLHKINLGNLRLSLKNFSYQGSLNLFKDSQEKNNIFVTLDIDEYNKDIVDDIASMVGKAYRAELIGPQQITKEVGISNKYGLADLPRFKEIQQLYERAVELTKQDGWAVVRNDHPLNLLRKDALEHPNLAIREASEHMYKRKLAELLLG